MGVIINHAISNIDGADLFRQLKIDFTSKSLDFPIYFGGPVDPGRGFILHGSDYRMKDTLISYNGLSLSSSVDVLEDIALGKGPEEKIVALGYAGWSPRQLETEVEANSWFSVPASKELIFNVANDTKWLMACRSVGVDPYMMSDNAGHA